MPRKVLVGSAILLLLMIFVALPVFAAALLNFEDATLGASVNTLSYPGVTFSSADWLVNDGSPLGTVHLLGPGDGCPGGDTLTVTFATSQSSVSFIWASYDDGLTVDVYSGGNLVSNEFFSGPFGSTATITGDFDQLVIGDGTGTGCAAIDDLSYSGAAQCRYPLPASAVVYNVPAGALAFFAPNADSYTGFNLPPGTWYISEFGESYAKVWIACDADPVYIPIENVIR